MRTYLDFEKPIAELESKVAELRTLAAEQGSVSIQEELTKLEAKAREALEETYSGLTPWQSRAFSVRMVLSATPCPYP